MTGFTLTPQEFTVMRTEDGRSVRMLSSDNAYIRLSVGGESVQLQSGQVYGTGGDLLPKEAWPGWLDEEIAKCNPASLVACGWLKPVTAEAAPPPPPLPPADPVEAMKRFLATMSPEERVSLLDTLASVETSDGGGDGDGDGDDPLA